MPKKLTYTMISTTQTSALITCKIEQTKRSKNSINHHMMCYCSSVIALGSRWSALRMACFVACLSMCLRVAFSAKFWLGRVDRILFNQNPGLNQFSTNFFEFSRLRIAVRPTF
ncbi:hypothetical protein Tsp_08141 [Trichinella spiralis]|uniref:hypothetical protein n=1 Tax=Trichinella spiralis TaxID=6334 RepID=UPI0001EFE4BB|nr:hypothetical protein Tsp_08141 [Trichinella spiralis]